MSKVTKKRLRMVALFFFLLSVSLYCGVGVLGYNIISTPPGHAIPRTPTGRYTTVTFPARGQKYLVYGFYLPGTAGSPTLISTPGLGSSSFDPYQLNRAQDLRDLGYSVLLIDLSDSSGNTVGNGHIAYGADERWDVLGAFDYLLTQHIAPGSIGLVGESLGAATSLLTAALEPRIRAVWADSSYTRADTAISDRAQQNGIPSIVVPGGLLWGWLSSGTRIWDAAPISAATTFAANGQAIYLVHDEQDTIVPFHHGVDLNNAYKAAGVDVTFWTVPGIDHVQAILVHPAEYLQRLDTFFKALLATTF